MFFNYRCHCLFTNDKFKSLLNILFIIMNIPESVSESGCSSCKRQENGDSTEADRPLKKARFAWQVKGKYHLKNELSIDKSSKSTSECNVAGSLSENESEREKICPNVEPNLEILGGLFEQDLCTLDSVTKTDQQILPNRNLVEEKLPYPRSISKENVDVNEFEIIMNSRNELEDQCIASWQARQMTKCFVDNTINSLIDGWMRGPLLTDINDDRLPFFGDAEPMEDNNDDSIENEGILMAISAHGLQNASASSDYGTNNASSNNSKPFLSPPSSPRSEDILDSSTRIRNDNYVKEISKNNTSQDVSDYAYSPYDSNKNEVIEEFDTINSNYSDTENSHFDFLDTAVSFAIQYKGLTSYGTDYG